MKAEELLSLLISIEDELTTQYNRFCTGDINRKTYQKRSEKIIQKQINLIEQFKKEILPNDVESYDAVIKLRKEIKDKNQDENIIDVNGWIMGVNWCKDYILDKNN